MYLKVAKLRPDAKLPARANLSDAGIDVFYCGEDIIHLPFGRNYLFSTGLSIEVPHGFALQVLNRSSMASKKGVVVGACLVDAGYSGELFIDLHVVGAYKGASNIEVEPVKISPGDKIAQLICIPVIHWMPIEVSKEELYSEIKVIS